MRTAGRDRGTMIPEQDIYDISATQKQRLGTRLQRGDCVYKYAKTTAEMTKNSLLMASTYHQDIMYAAVPTANAIGSNEIHVTVGAADGIANGGVFAAHSMEGGRVCIFHDPDPNDIISVFGILDNTAATSGSDMTITLDGELPVATVVGTSIIEAMGSPYLCTNANTGGERFFVGVPMRIATSASPYLWVQTWGPSWAAPQTGVGASANHGLVVARHDGSLDIISTSGYEDAQIVGSVMTYSQSGGQGLPFIMLQISP